MFEHLNNHSNVNAGVIMEDVCQIKVINEKKVDYVKDQMLEDNVFGNLSDTFKTLGDNTRIRILFALSKEELCVCDISAVLDMSISAVSHQLRVLRNMNLVKHKKEGKIVYYSLNDDHIVRLLKMAYEHVTE